MIITQCGKSNFIIISSCYDELSLIVSYIVDTFQCCALSMQPSESNYRCHLFLFCLYCVCGSLQRMPLLMCCLLTGFFFLFLFQAFTLSYSLFHVILIYYLSNDGFVSFLWNYRIISYFSINATLSICILLRSTDFTVRVTPYKL